MNAIEAYNAIDFSMTISATVSEYGTERTRSYEASRSICAQAASHIRSTDQARIARFIASRIFIDFDDESGETTISNVSYTVSR